MMISPLNEFGVAATGVAAFCLVVGQPVACVIVGVLGFACGVAELLVGWRE
jgi:hypothetical protein